MDQGQRVPRLSVSALQELRRIYCKHLLEVFASRETQELYEQGCISGQFSEGDGKRAFIVESVTPMGVAVLDDAEATPTSPHGGRFGSRSA